MISLRSIAIGLGAMVFMFGAIDFVGPWTLWLTVPLGLYACGVADQLDIREGRRPGLSGGPR